METVDERTETWPVKDNLRAAMDRIKYQYEAMPLPVYIDDRFVKPSDAYEALKGAIVEVQFELRHFRIQKKKVDSFNAKVQQIFVLKPGVPRPRSVFKRWNVEDGPMKTQSKIARVQKDVVANGEDAGKSNVAANGDDDVVRSLTCGVPTLELQILPAPRSSTEGSQVAESSAQGGKHTIARANED